ncbi:MAG: di-trans,poly-cis-decaprenylcistransferase, partial [Candidatus Diapherotrites archaeon]|nr:di-trans,poly-cis-decaprenylcistransferase [Candidatus Diapherotrites archaeon]
DGNRRFAQKNNIALLSAYKLGTQKAWDVFDWINKYPEIKTGTFYTLSLENLQRKKTELKLLYKIFEKELDKVFSSGLFEANKIKLKVIGRTDLLPKKLREKIQSTEEYTQDFNKKTMNLALGYTGQIEIIDAAKKIAEQYKQGMLKLNELTTDSFKNFLYADFPSPDLIVRTSGTKRLSGFLTYQSAYSELYFLDKYWPEVNETDIDNAIEEYNLRQRKFGK